MRELFREECEDVTVVNNSAKSGKINTASFIIFAFLAILVVTEIVILATHPHLYSSYIIVRPERGIAFVLKKSNNPRLFHYKGYAQTNTSCRVHNIMKENTRMERIENNQPWSNAALTEEYVFVQNMFSWHKLLFDDLRREGATLSCIYHYFFGNGMFRSYLPTLQYLFVSAQIFKLKQQIEITSIQLRSLYLKEKRQLEKLSKIENKERQRRMMVAESLPSPTKSEWTTLDREEALSDAAFDEKIKQLQKYHASVHDDYENRKTQLQDPLTPSKQQSALDNKINFKKAQSKIQNVLSGTTKEIQAVEQAKLKFVIQLQAYENFIG